MKSSPFIFFDLGQTLVNEWDFINHFDAKFLELLNGFGARIDIRNYHAVRDSIIRDRKIGHGGVRELVIELCKALLPPGYGDPVLRRIDLEIKQARKSLFRFADDAEPTLQKLSDNHELGIIANQAEDIMGLIKSAGFEKYFKVMVISSIVKLKKPDPAIFQLALKQAERDAGQCIMVGDRLDTDICPANSLGMTTIRTTDSLFALQQPISKCEQPTYTASRLSEIPLLVEKIIIK